jgi:hypothetical protein
MSESVSTLQQIADQTVALRLGTPSTRSRDIVSGFGRESNAAMGINDQSSTSISPTRTPKQSLSTVSPAAMGANLSSNMSVSSATTFTTTAQKLATPRANKAAALRRASVVGTFSSPVKGEPFSSKRIWQ